MTTKFDIGEMVYIKAVITTMRICEDGKPRYTLWIDRNHPSLSFPEEWLVKIDDADQPMSADVREHYEKLAEHYNQKAVQNDRRNI